MPIGISIRSPAPQRRGAARHGARGMQHALPSRTAHRVGRGADTPCLTASPVFARCTPQNRDSTEAPLAATWWRNAAVSAAVCAVAGSLAAAPAAFLAPLALGQLVPAALSPQWEVDQDTVRARSHTLTPPRLPLTFTYQPVCRSQLAFSLGTFGVLASAVDRRRRTSLAAVCAAWRVAGHVHTSPQCTSVPLHCGEGALDAAMNADIAATALCTVIALAVALAAMDRALPAGENR